MKNISDKTLENAAKGNMAAFKDIYEATSGLVYGTALRITCNKCDVYYNQVVMLK